MRHTTALIVILASMLLPASSPSAIETRSAATHARMLPIALSPPTEILMTLDTSRFDGSWYVVLYCQQAPDGALSYTYRFTAQVRDGVLHGQRGDQGSQDWLTLDGAIEPDGTASLDARGLTNDVYHAMGRFEGTRGAASRIEGRVCNLSFTRQ